MSVSFKSKASWTGLLNKGARLFYLAFINPKNENLEAGRKEGILNFILIGVITLGVLFDAVVFFVSLARGDAHSGISFSSFSIVVLVFGLLLYLSRKGHSSLSSHALVVILFILNSYAAVVWGVGLPTALLGYALLILVSGLLISRKFSLVAAVVVALTVMVIGYQQVTGAWKYETDWGLETQKVYDVVEYSLFLLLISGVSSLSTREIEYSLKRAQESEVALKEERDLLEIKVEERTAELRKVEVEKMAQVYKITEFGRLSAGLFHDLINSLNVVSLYIEQLKNQQPEIRGELRNIFEATHRLDDFIQAIRKQIKNQEVEKIFSFEEEVNHVVDILAFKARSKAIKLNVTSETSAKIFGNSLKFFQIVSNLVSNAIDSYPDSLDDKKRVVDISLRSDKSHLYLEVKDNGSGIVPENLPRIFDAFFSTKQAEHGIGIGLTTIKEIIEAKFFGTIRVESTQDVGTIFFVTIPINHDIELRVN